MLDFILGGSKTGKTSLVFDRIEQLSRENKKSFLIVPEQYTFEAEKQLFERLSPALFQNVTVISCTRLSHIILSELGGKGKKYAGTAEKIVLMDTAIENLKDELVFYKKPAGKAGFTSMMLSMADELKHANVLPQMLMEQKDNTKNKSLSDKLYETALITGEYNALLSQSYLDPLDDIARAAKLLHESGYLNGSHVFFDEFKGFTNAEIALIEEMLVSAESVTFALCIDDERAAQSKNSVFSSVCDTYSALISKARKHGVKVLTGTKLVKNHYHSKQLANFEHSLFMAGAGQDDNESHDIKVYLCQNEYSEADTAMAVITELVREKGYRYSDIAVIARNFSEYYNILKDAFSKYKIPFYADMPQPVSAKPIIKFVLAVLSVASGGFNSENIFSLLKCGLCGYERERISELENYCFVWNINGESFLNEYKNPPLGYAKDLTEDDKAVLLRINEIRENFLLPLRDFRNSVLEVDAKAFSEKLYNFILDMKVNEYAEEAASRLNTSNKPEEAAEYSRTWDILMSLLDTMAFTSDGTVITPKRYEKLFILAAAEETITGLPQTIDAVIAGEADRIRTGEKKAVIVLSVNENVFPALPSPPPVFTDRERSELSELDLNIGKPMREQVREERFIAYKILTSPTQKLIMTARQSDITGKKYLPSIVITQTQAMYKNAVVFQEDLPAEFYAKTYESTFSQYAKNYAEQSSFTAAAKMLLEADKTMSAKKQAFDIAVSGGEYSISPENAKAVFGSVMNISPTRIEDYYKCPFAYFAKHGLKVNPLKQAALDPLQTGTLIHYVLEKTVPYISEIEKLDKKELKEHVLNILNEYLLSVMGGDEEKTARFKYLFERIGETVYKVAEHICKEQNQSKFLPARLECEIGGEGEISPLKLITPNGACLYLRGKIDRLDIYKTENGSRYFRIIDYKSGMKDFKLYEAMQGINLQMLIYLECVANNTKKGELSSLLPAGILYMPVFESPMRLDRTAGEDEIENSRRKMFAMNGLVLFNDDIILAMENSMQGEFIDLTFTKKDILAANSMRSVILPEDIQRVFKHLNDLACEMADSLNEGKINACPSEGSCDYCDYKTVCELLREPERKIEKYSQKTVKELLDDIENPKQSDNKNIEED